MRDTVGLVEHNASDNSSGVTLRLFANSLTVGSWPNVFESCSEALEAFNDSSFKERLTLTVPPSLNKRLISPRITGTA